MMPPMNWDDVRVFVAIARAKSLGAGARAVGLDRSTASRRIAALETSLGARLFLRTRDGLRLSTVGDGLLVHAERMSADATALASAASQAGDQVRGRVRLATTESLAAMLVRGGLLDLSQRHPGLELEVLGENRIVDLSRGDADLALRVSPVREPSLRAKRVARLPFSLYAAERYVARRGRPLGERDLDGHDAVAYGGEFVALPEAKWLGAQAGVRVVLRTTSVTAMISAVIDGFGVAPIAGAWAERELGLVRLFEIDALQPRSLWLAMHPDSATRAAVRAVATRVGEIAKRGEGAA
jgi:DNA-binding transcriptional LysR family regulator